jgi:AraC family transcriptional regulator
MDGDRNTEADRLAAVVLGSLDEPSGTGSLARKAYHSRTHFYRLCQAWIDESPGAMRRRLLLERAAWQLGRTQVPVTQIALDANYGSLEAFTRAFRKAFRVSPSLFRRMGATNICLPAPNGIHFCAPRAHEKGTQKSMDLYDRFLGTDSWHTRKLLEHAASLSDELLDRSLNTTAPVDGWGADRSLRELLERLVLTKEIWTAALAGGQMPATADIPAAERTPAALLRRFEKIEAEFQRTLGDVRARDAWDDTFIDALCEPPETFTFGGVFAEVVTYNTYRRLMALSALQQLGAPMPGCGSPLEYEQQLPSLRPQPAVKS